YADVGSFWRPRAPRLALRKAYATPKGPPGQEGSRLRRGAKGYSGRVVTSPARWPLPSVLAADIEPHVGQLVELPAHVGLEGDHPARGVEPEVGSKLGSDPRRPREPSVAHRAHRREELGKRRLPVEEGSAALLEAQPAQLCLG